MEYIPEGGGSHHWQLRNGHGRLHFVTIDDLDNKEWLGHSRDVVFEGLRRALDTAAALGRLAGLEFVVSALAAGDGRLLHRVDDRYALSVFPYLAGRSFPFGPYPDPRLCELALDSIARLHLSTPSVREAGALRGAELFGSRRPGRLSAGSRKAVGRRTLCGAGPSAPRRSGA